MLFDLSEHVNLPNYSHLATLASSIVYYYINCIILFIMKIGVHGGIIVAFNGKARSFTSVTLILGILTRKLMLEKGWSFQV